MSYQDYFIYKGQAYGIGTKVKLARSVQFFTEGSSLSKLKNADDFKVQTYTFTHGTTDGVFTFWWKENEDPWDEKYYARSQAVVNNPNEQILEIVEAVHVELVSWQKKAINNMISGEVPADVFGGVLLYIVIMLVALIFNDRWIIWIFATVVFIWWLLNQYRT